MNGPAISVEIFSPRMLFPGWLEVDLFQSYQVFSCLSCVAFILTLGGTIKVS